MDQKLTALTSLPAIDRANDLLYIVDVSGSTSNKTTPNFMLGITGAPVGTTDIQSLTNKTITAPTISSPVLSGTITGTYTLGGTPTFPSSVVTLTGSQTLTNKVLTSPTINTPTISNATITANAISGFTTANSGTIYGVPIVLGVIANAGTVNGSAIVGGTVGSAAVAIGVPVQVVTSSFTSVATGTTLIPTDDTIPQNTEGTEFMTLSITPKSATNILVIEAFALSSTSIVTNASIALFQDSTANALAAASSTIPGVTYTLVIPVTHTMVAGTTSATTFRVRGGPSAASTFTFNGTSGGRLFGAISKSFIKITEYKA